MKYCSDCFSTDIIFFGAEKEVTTDIIGRNAYSCLDCGAISAENTDGSFSELEENFIIDLKAKEKPLENLGSNDTDPTAATLNWRNIENILGKTMTAKDLVDLRSFWTKDKLIQKALTHRIPLI